MSFVYTVDQIRQAEQVLLSVESHPDQLMQEAAEAVAAAAGVMLAAPAPRFAEGRRVLLLVGSGGNGGDALYAGARLAEAGFGVDAVLLGREGRVHIPALEAFLAAGGRILEELPLPHQYRLIIDGILGIGGRGGIEPEIADLVDDAGSFHIPILAIDLPSGVAADTGALPTELLVEARGFAEEDQDYATILLPAHVRADVTITFGGLRRVHAISPHCGEVLLADLQLPETQPLSLELFDTAISVEGHPPVLSYRAWAPTAGFDWSTAETVTLVPGDRPDLDLPGEPGADGDKYSGGVVGICAGSPAYRGAAVLCATGAVRATSSMVRYLGSGAEEVIRALPEVVAHPDIEKSGRTQAWVVGPGRGTDGAARAELTQLLTRPEPVLIDADAITLLAAHQDLRVLLKERAGDTLLTPHAGEFTRLAASLAVEIPGLEVDRIGAVQTLAAELKCSVLLKGRHTIIVVDGRVVIVDAGSSWGATAGSGDVLAGIAGALLAHGAVSLAAAHHRHPRMPTSQVPSPSSLAVTAVHIHSVAAALAAQTPEGPAPTSASKIAEAIPRAIAWLATRCDR